MRACHEVDELTSDKRDNGGSRSVEEKRGNGFSNDGHWNSLPYVRHNAREEETYGGKQTKCGRARTNIQKTLHLMKCSRIYSLATLGFFVIHKTMTGCRPQKRQMPLPMRMPMPMQMPFFYR